MKELNKKDTHKKLLTDLKSTDKQVILNSIKSLREEGICSDIPMLLDIMLENPEEEIQKAVRNLLIDIKENKASEGIIDAINDKRYSSLKKELVSICWESRLSFSNYLDVFVDILIKENFQTAFEAFTVIEHMTGNITDQEKGLQAQRLKDAIALADEQRKGLLHEAIHLIMDISDEDNY